MPVIATPAASPRTPSCDLPVVDSTPSPVPCAGQFLLVATPGKSRGKPVLSRTQAIRIPGGQAAEINWTMRDQNGSPVDLSDCLGCEAVESSSSTSSEEVTAQAYAIRFHISEDPCPNPAVRTFCATDVTVIDASGISLACPTRTYSLKFRMTEDICLGAPSGRSCYESGVDVVSAADGTVRISIPETTTAQPGVYFGQVALVGTRDDGNEYVIFANTFYLYIEKTAWSERRHGAGPPTIAEIRMQLRDSSSAESFLLDNIKFDDAEIAAAAALPVMQWNETPPPIQVFTTRNFPFRYHWLQAICGHLFLMAAEQYRANNLKYSAAGISVDDQDKEPNYERAAQTRLGLWNSWMRMKKASMNLADCWGGIGSDYARWG